MYKIENSIIASSERLRSLALSKNIHLWFQDFLANIDQNFWLSLPNKDVDLHLSSSNC